MFVVFSQIEIDTKYQKQTCGLCGNFDTISNDLIKDGKRLFGIHCRFNIEKHLGPTCKNQFHIDTTQ